MDKLEATTVEISFKTGIPLSQTSTLCEGSDASQSQEKLADTLPTLSYYDASANKSDVKKPTKLQLLRSNDYTIVFVSSFCLFHQLFACTLYTPVIPARLEAIGVVGVEASTGYLGSVWAAGCIVGSLFAAWLPTVYKNSRVQLLAYNSLLVAAGLLLAFVKSFSGLMAGRALHGLGASGLWLVATCLITDNVNPAKIGIFMGLAQIGYAMGNSLSPTLGGTMYGQMGWEALCYFALGMAALNALLIFVYLEKKQVPGAPVLAPLFASEALVTEASAQQNQYSMPARLKLFLTNPKLIIGLLVASMWGAFSSSILNTALTLRLGDRYNLSSAVVGYTFLAMAGPNIVLAPLAGLLTDRLGARPLILCCLASLTIYCGVLAIDALPYAGLLAVLVGVGASSSFIATPTIVFLSKVDLFYGNPIGSSLICGLWSTCSSLASLVFPMLTGAVLGKVGVSMGWKILLGVFAGVILAALTFIFFHMHLPSTLSAPATSQSTESDLEKGDSAEKAV